MTLLQKPAIQILIVALVSGGVGGGIWLQKTHENDPKAPAPANKTLGVNAPEKVDTERGDVTRKVVESGKVEKLILPKEKSPPPDPIEKIEAKPRDETPERKQLPELVHLQKTLEPRFLPEEPRIFGPRGLLIRAALVLTVDSSTIETPVLGLVIEDVYWNGELLVPAGTQVFAKATPGKTRDRIEVRGQFTFVWGDGREYKINGIALDHETEEDGTFSITDGSAGIRGEVLKTDEYAELKLLVASVVSGLGRSSQETYRTVLGEEAVNSASNAVLEGVSEASDRYAELLLSRIEEDLTFVRVAAGTTFYVFTEDVFEPDLASIAGVRQGNDALSSIELQRRAYEAAAADYRDDPRQAAPSGPGGGPSSAEESLQRRHSAESRDAYLDRIATLIESSRKYEAPAEAPAPRP
ncbi:MAG: hypothetical protein KDM91_19065 [Verrucomicrobiae bacterium]|nr:hypothetical protein [Verrucomicrobiae bacterium]MCP5551654.1 hypothetical protein [Akkermansiaceae bacterium]